MELNYQTNDLPKTQIIKTEGYWTYTADKKLLDPLCGNTAFIFGYGNAKIISSMISTQSYISFLRGMSNESCIENDQLADQICRRGNFKDLAWAVSGSDGVEAAVYINDQYWKNLGQDKPTVVTFRPGYHGTTYLSKLFREEYPVGDRAIVIERNEHDTDTLQSLEAILELCPGVGAVLIESAPWNGGLNLWSREFWTNLRLICDRYKINFIVDDVLGGVGKLGYFFSHEKYGVQPDISVLGKSLTGGYSPLSCACVTEKISQVVKPTWNFGHTWSPNMGGIGAALEVLSTFDNYDFKKIENELTKIAYNLENQQLIKNYKVCGLLLYLNFDRTYPNDFLYKSGINGNANENNGIFICAPAIADDQYFKELYSRLSAALL